jgi:molybdopterin synthase sulfur carrier subunit
VAHEDEGVKLLYFAWVRQKIGMGEETLTLPAGVATLAGLAEFLVTRGGSYADVFGDTARLRAAVNQTHAGFDAPLRDSDEVAFFPPVTGG